MLIDLDGVVQPVEGSSPHWEMFRTVLCDPHIFDPMVEAIDRSVSEAEVARQPLDSRRIVATALDYLSSCGTGSSRAVFDNLKTALLAEFSA